MSEERRNTQRIQDELPVSEIFLSVQGEGVNIGTPSVFLRTYFCNLTCVWCDTKYTWMNQDRSRAGVDYSSMTMREVFDRVMRFKCDHLVLTGGEPLLHQKLLVPLLSKLKNERMYIEVETNGTIAPAPEMLHVVDCFNVSPKTSNSQVNPKARARPRALETFVASGKAWFKFVVRDPCDVLEIEELVSRFSIPTGRVILMPEGNEPEVLFKRGRWLVEVCKERGFRFTPRLHILLFGNMRET